MGAANVPAGQVEDAESFAEGAARELIEETQLAVPLVDLDLCETYEIEPRYRSLYSPGDHSVTVAAGRGAARLGADAEPRAHRASLDDAIALLSWPEAKAGLRALGARLGLSAGHVD